MPKTKGNKRKMIGWNLPCNVTAWKQVIVKLLQARWRFDIIECDCHFSQVFGSTSILKEDDKIRVSAYSPYASNQTSKPKTRCQIN